MTVKTYPSQTEDVVRKDLVPSFLTAPIGALTTYPTSTSTTLSPLSAAGVVTYPSSADTTVSPLASLIARHGGVYVGKRALDKWRYTLTPNRTVVIVGDSLAQGNVGGEDPWPERLARDLGNWMGPRLTTTPGFYGLYRSGSLLTSVNGDREWQPHGTWTQVAATLNYDLAPYNSTYICPDASATAIRTAADCATTANGFAITSTATMQFVAGDVGALITGTNVPPNTYISSVTSTTAARLSQRATATGSSLTMSIHGATLSWSRNLSTNNNSRWTWDGTTTAGSTAITSPTANFQQTDVGRAITGTGIQSGTTIAAVTDYQTATLALAATSSVAAIAVFILHDARVVNVSATNGSAVITTTADTFLSSDVGSRIMATAGVIPNGTTILSVQSPRSATLSTNAATSSATGVSTTIATDVFNKTSHGIANNTVVVLSGLANTTNISNGVPYYVVATAANTFQLSLTLGGTAIDLQGSTDAAVAVTFPTVINAYRGQRIVSDSVTNTTTTVTSASAGFTQADVGRQVVGSNIPNNTSIASVTNSTTIVLSNAVAVTATFGMLTIAAYVPTPIAAMGIMWVDGIASNGTNFTYSIDGGTNWVQVAQTTSGGPILKQTVVTVTNPTALIIRANTGPGISPTTKSQTIQAGVFVWQAVPTQPLANGIQVYNLARDAFGLKNVTHGGLGDGMAFLDNGGSGWPGLRPDLVIVLFTNDQVLYSETEWVSALNRLIDRVQSYADILFIAPYEQTSVGHSLATTLAYNADMRAACDVTTARWTCTDGVTSNSSTAISSATMSFAQSDVGRTITDSAGKIPASTTIATVTSATAATLSQATGGSGASTGNTFTITGRAVDTGSALLDLYQAWAAQGATGYTAANADGLMYDQGHPSQDGHNEIGARVSRIIRVFS